MDSERVTVLETQREQDQKILQETRDDVSIIRSDVEMIKLTLQKQSGFISGALFVLVPLWTGIVAVVASAWQYFTDKGDIP
jgi:hypothetical protein